MHQIQGRGLAIQWPQAGAWPSSDCHHFTPGLHNSADGICILPTALLVLPVCVSSKLCRTDGRPDAARKARWGGPAESRHKTSE
jgi:hypothetical protein